MYIGLSDLTRRGQGLRVTDIVIHPGWNLASMTNDITMGHDLALIRLEVSPSLSEVIWPACLPDPFFDSDLAPVGDDVSVVGFGMTNTKTQDHSDLLQKADLKVRCQSPLHSQPTMADCFRLLIPGCASLRTIGTCSEIRFAPRAAPVSLEAAWRTPALETAAVRGHKLYKCTQNRFCPPRRPSDLQRGPEDTGRGGQLRGDGVWGEREARSVH